MSATAATARIANAGELAGQGMAELRELALRVAGAGLAACDVGLATESAVAAQNGAGSRSPGGPTRSPRTRA